MIKPISLLSIAAVAMLGTAPMVQAQSPVKAYKEDLAKAIGSKTGTAACKAASKVLGKYALSDPSKIVSFVKLAQKSLSKVVDDKLAGKCVQSQVKAFAGNYFKGLKKYDPADRKFSKAVTLLVSKLPKSQKTDPVLQKIYGELDKVNTKNGGGGSARQVMADLVFDAGGKLPPNVS